LIILFISPHSPQHVYKPEDIWGYDPKGDDFDDEEGEDLENGDGMILDGGEGIPAMETDAWLKRQGRVQNE
jgi:hypothetical protein